jgi:hypothetical protein
MNTDHRKLQTALEDGPKSLGDLRRMHELPPETVLRLIAEFPDRLLETTTIVRGRQTPAVALGSELSEDAKLFIALVRGGGKAGISGQKLYRAGIKSQDSARLAREFEALVSAAKKGVKTVYYWRQRATPEKFEQSSAAESPGGVAVAAQDASGPADKVETPERPPETPQEPANLRQGNRSQNFEENDAAEGNKSKNFEELEAQRDRLIELVKDGVRTSDYLAAFGFDVRSLSQICDSWPDIFVAESRNLSGTEHGEFVAIGLRSHVSQICETSTPVEPTPSLQPALAEIVPPDQLHDLLWKPASPGMSHSRNDPRRTRGGLVRTRRPLIEV